MAIVSDRDEIVPCNSERSWREEMKRAIRDPRHLCRLLGLPSTIAEMAVEATRQFPLFVPRPFVARMTPGDRGDPLLRQVLPVNEELQPVAGFSRDPVDDLAAQVRPGIIRKYRGRALLMVSGACAVHCRYCFRRFFPYCDQPRSPVEWEPVLEQLAEDRQLEEVILSGGDPLALTDEQLAQLLARLGQILPLRRLRVHTRLPIVIPQRVTKRLLSSLQAAGPRCVVVVHVNHPREIDQAVADSLNRLVSSGILVLNQTVLLRGINDRPDVLAELCRRLVDLRVLPYYLHQLDRVRGAAHFEVPVELGIRLVEQLRDLLPGYAVPRYVRDQIGHASKTVLA
jgi:EF-P beta-lysylation protein EpmB